MTGGDHGIYDKNPNPEGINGVSYDPCPANPSPSDSADYFASCFKDRPFAESSFGPIELMQVLTQEFSKCHTGLAYFVKASLTSPTCTVHKSTHRPIWPVPPVRWSWTANPKPNPRRRKRRKFHAVRSRLLNCLICTLNWEVLGHPSVPPAHARLGASISPAQHQVIQRFEGLLSHFLRSGPFQGAELGRSAGKFQGLIDSMQELPAQFTGSEDLFELLTELHKSFDPYQSHFSKPESDPTPAEAMSTDFGAVTVSMPSSKPVVASRVKWENPPSFSAAEYLDPLVREAYLDPEVLRLPGSDCPPSRPAKMHIAKSEMLALIERWDQLGACQIIRADSKDFSEAIGVFAVDKDLDYDRLIINPKTINSRMASLSYTTKELAPGCMLSLLSLKPGEMFRFNADDLSDYYYCFKVSPLRARRNAFRMVFNSAELSHLKCYNPSFDGHSLLVCLATLAMGDSLAVEVGQQAHKHVLQVWCGSMQPQETLRYRHPIPRSDFVELLAIDDHVGLQKLPISDFPQQPKLRDTQVFDQATHAYTSVGLVQHEKKRKRNQVVGTILGADFDGLEGKVMAPRARVSILCMISLQIARLRCCTPRLLSVLLGCWIHVILFRRAIFAVVEQLFKEGQGKGQDEIFTLSRQACCELQVLSILGPIAQTDIRTKYSSKIFCTDASPFGGAVIAAEVGEQVIEEIWRYSEQRGSQSPIVLPPHSPIPSALSEGILFDCIELFRGEGNWSEAHSSRGFRVHDGVDISGRRLRFLDLSQPAVFHELCSLALRRVCRDWHAGVPCLSYGTLRRPQVRSKRYPAGFDPSDPFTAFHNMLGRRTAFLLTIVFLSGAFVSVEQPGNSRLFLLHCYRVLVQLGCIVSHFCFCQFGSPFQKASKWLHNKPWLIPIECKCSCRYKGHHFVVQGSFTRESIAEFESRCVPSSRFVYGRAPQIGEHVSSFSALYPLRLVHSMASGLSNAVQGNVSSIPFSHRIRSMKEVGLDTDHLTPLRSTEPLYPDRPWHENPEWVTELCDSLPFKELFRYKFRKTGHINVNEMRTYKSFIKACAKTDQDSRLVALLDSRVTIGAVSKGRSSSPALSRVLRGTLPYVLGGGLYPGLLHCGSKVNRSDGPSRDRELEGPTKDLPQWLLALQQGDYRGFDAAVSSSRFPLNAARWLRFLLLLAGDIEENPGPRRGKMDLTVGFVKATSDRMQHCFSAFREWCFEHLEVSPDAIVAEPEALAWSLRAYGLYLFEAGLPRYLLVYSITACQDMFPACRPFMTVAWQIDKKWQLHEPGVCRAVLPGVVVRAISALGALWGWRIWTAIFLLGFIAMLHPSEMLALTRKDLVFPADLHYDSQSLYVRVKDPKTARFARRQHSRVDDQNIIAILFAEFGGLGLNEKLYPGSISTFRKQWNCIMDHLGIPCKQKDRGATPGVLRGSGATFYYTCTEDLSWVAWRGRWSRQKTLEFYLQEVGAQMLIHELDSWAKARIFPLADASWAVLCTCYNLAGQNFRDGRD